MNGIFLLLWALASSLMASCDLRSPTSESESSVPRPMFPGLPPAPCADGKGFLEQEVVGGPQKLSMLFYFLDLP